MWLTTHRYLSFNSYIIFLFLLFITSKVEYSIIHYSIYIIIVIHYLLLYIPLRPLSLSLFTDNEGDNSFSLYQTNC